MVMAQGFTEEQVDGILEDVEGSDLIDERTRALLRFAEKVTRHSHKIVERDIRTLRDLGLVDEEILEALHVIAFFNYVDRMADASGAPVENLRQLMAGAS